MFRVDEGLEVHIPRDAMDFSQYITGLAALVAQSPGWDPFARSAHVLRHRQADYLELRT